MEVHPLKIDRIQSEGALPPVIAQAYRQKNLQPESGDILVIASKVLAYSQGLLRTVDSSEAFRNLIKAEADLLFEEGDMTLTLKNKTLVPNAGIDRSNVPEGKAILWPKDPFVSAEKIRAELMGTFKLSVFGVVISDSVCHPLRQGTSGIAIGWAGFEGVQDERDKKDLFGKPLKYTKMAVADQLAATANLVMGESDASIPFVLIRHFEVCFTDRSFSEDDYFLAPEYCIFKPVYNSRLFHDLSGGTSIMISHPH